MKRQKSTFTIRIEWSDRSDRSEHSPSVFGALPTAAILPDGARVEIDSDDIQATIWNNNVPFEGWVKMGNEVSVKEKSWGDDGFRSVGRSGASLEILAPEGTVFLFGQGCDSCGEFLGEIGEDELFHGCVPIIRCEQCTKIAAEQAALMEEAQS